MGVCGWNRTAAESMGDSMAGQQERLDNTYTRLLSRTCTAPRILRYRNTHGTVRSTVPSYERYRGVYSTVRSTVPSSVQYRKRYGTVHDFSRLHHECLRAMETVHILRGVGC
jgi:hypothetical protein